MWFKKHLNWTYILAILIALIIYVITSVTAESYHLDWLWNISMFAFFILLLAVIGVGAWVIKQKGGSLFNLFWLLLSWIGIIVILCLVNKRGVKPSVDQIAQDNLRAASWQQRER